MKVKRHGGIHLQHKSAGSTLTRDRVNMRNPTEGSLGVEKELVVYVYSRTQFGHYNEQTASCRLSKYIELSLKRTKDAKFRK